MSEAYEITTRDRFGLRTTKPLWRVGECGHAVPLSAPASDACAICSDYEEAYRLDALSAASEAFEKSLHHC